MPKTIEDYYLTVADLRKAIEGMDGSCPVAYHRVEDSYFEPGGGWSETSLVLPFEGESGQFIRAWAAYPGTDQHDRKCLCITAFY